jgi:predicted nucleotidyltransferase
MEAIFSTKERLKILEAIIYRNTLISVNLVASQLKLSKGLVSKYCDILVREGVLKRTDEKFSVSESSLVRAIRIMFNLKSIPVSLFRKYPFVKSAGLYGSCARGENTEDSDVDLWIMVDKTAEEKLAAMTSELDRKVKKIRPLILTVDKIEKMYKEDETFYHSLAFGSLILYGDKNGIQL